jgi:hypothetical protein
VVDEAYINRLYLLEVSVAVVIDVITLLLKLLLYHVPPMLTGTSR